MTVSGKNQLSQSADLTEVVKRAGLFLGPSLFLFILLFVKPAEMPPPAVAVFAATAWIAIWWITEPVPLPVTSLLPIILFPFLGVLELG